MRKRTSQNPNYEISRAEIAQVAARWLPDFFQGVAVDPVRLRSLHYRGSAAGVLSTLVPHDEVEEDDGDDGSQIDSEALICLTSDKPRRRVRGLRLLASIEAPTDLAEWCLPGDRAACPAPQRKVAASASLPGKPRDTGPCQSQVGVSFAGIIRSRRRVPSASICKVRAPQRSVRWTAVPRSTNCARTWGAG